MNNVKKIDLEKRDSRMMYDRLRETTKERSNHGGTVKGMVIY